MSKIKGNKIIYPILSPIGSQDEIMDKMVKVAKLEKCNTSDLIYKREVYYFKHEDIDEEGWTDTAEISRTYK